MSKPPQHSPRPWTYDKIRCSIINGHDKPICEMTQYSYEVDVDLLLAAPDLLRLLRVLTSNGTHEEGEAAHDEAEALIARLDGCE